MPEERVHLGGRDAVVPALGRKETRRGHPERREHVSGEDLVKRPARNALYDLHQDDGAQVRVHELCAGRGQQRGCVHHAQGPRPWWTHPPCCPPPAHSSCTPTLAPSSLCKS